MEFKISIIDATPQELAQVLHNIGALSEGSTMALEAPTKQFTAKFDPKATAKVGFQPETDEEYLLRKEQEGEANVSAETAKKATTAAATGTRTRRTRAQMEADEKAEAEAKKGGRATEEAEEEGRSSKRAGRVEEMPNLTEKMKEVADELIECFKKKKDGEDALSDILRVFGVDQLADVAPADRTAVIAAMRKEIES